MTPQQAQLAKSHPEAFNAGVEVEQERVHQIMTLAASIGATAQRAITQGHTVAEALAGLRAHAVTVGRSEELERAVADLDLGGKSPHVSSAAPAQRPSGSASGDLGDRVVQLLDAQRGGTATASVEPVPAPRPAAADSGARDFADSVVEALDQRRRGAVG